MRWCLNTKRAVVIQNVIETRAEDAVVRLPRVEDLLSLQREETVTVTDVMTMTEDAMNAQGLGQEAEIDDDQVVAEVVTDTTVDELHSRK